MTKSATPVHNIVEILPTLGPHFRMPQFFSILVSVVLPQIVTFLLNGILMQNRNRDA